MGVRGGSRGVLEVRHIPDMCVLNEGQRRKSRPGQKRPICIRRRRKWGRMRDHTRVPDLSSIKEEIQSTRV